MFKSSYLIAAGAFLALAACTSRPTNQFNLSGTIDGADGQTLYLQGYGNDTTFVDSVVIADGKFAFSGNINKPTAGALYIGQPAYGNPALMSVFLEPTDMNVSGLKTGDFSEGVMTGSKSQDEQAEYDKMSNELSQQMKAAQEEMQSASPEQQALLGAKIDSLTNLAQSKTLDFIKSHPASYVTPRLLMFQSGHMSLDELKEVYNSLSPEIQAECEETAKEIAAQEAVQPGKPAPDLIGNDPSGKEIKLSDLKGKVVLIDFWATWCKPCRAALPHVAELYKKYHDKGFEVFCVGDNDSDPENWKAVIVEEGMQNYYNILRGMKTIRDEQGNFVDFDRSNDQSEKYAVHYLPTKYLIAADGTIIGKMDSNEDLDKKLEEIFK